MLFNKVGYRVIINLKYIEGLTKLYKFIVIKLLNSTLILNHKAIYTLMDNYT
jgi:hypothetical protein